MTTTMMTPQAAPPLASAEESELDGQMVQAYILSCGGCKKSEIYKSGRRLLRRIEAEGKARAAGWVNWHGVWVCSTCRPTWRRP